MRKLTVRLLVAGLAVLLAVALQGSFGGGSFGGSSFRGGGGGAAAGVRVSAAVAVDGAWPVVSVKSVQGFVHVVVVDVYDEGAAHLVGDAPAPKQRGAVVPEIEVSAADLDSLTVAVRSFTDTDTTLGEVVVFGPQKVAVRRGGGAGLDLDAVVSLEDEPGTGWSVRGRSDLGYDHRVEMTCSLVAGLYSEIGDTSWTAWFAADSLGALHDVTHLESGVTLFHGDSLFVNWSAVSPDSSVTFATLSDTLVVDHGYQVLAITFASAAWDMIGDTGRRTQMLEPPGGTHPYFREALADELIAWDSPDSLHVIYTRQNIAAPTTCVSTADQSMLFRAFPDGSYAGSSAAMAVMYFDYERFLPSDVTIVDAKLTARYVTAASRGFTASQGFMAVLDTISGDAAWLSAEGACMGSAFARASSWNYADIGNEIGWADPPEATGTTLSARTRLRHYGITGPLTHSETTINQNDTLYFDVTEQMQYALDYGKSNYGFWLAGEYPSTSVEIRCGVNASVRHIQPTLWIAYRERENVQPWDGQAFAFNFQTDDQCLSHLAYVDLMDSYGWPMTFYTYGNPWLDPATDYAEFLATPLATRLTPTQMRALYDAGHEIGHHSRSHGQRHGDGYGLGGILADTDSLHYEIDRGWLHEALGLTPEDTTSIITTFAYPAGGYGAVAVRALASQGYQMARVAGSSVGVQEPPWFRVGGAHAATQATDGRMLLGLGQAVNLFSVGNSLPMTGIAGQSYDADSLTVRNNLANAFDAAWRNGRYVIDTFSHDIPGHTDNCDYSGSIMSFDQARWMLEYIQDRGDVSVNTMQHWAAYYRARAQAIDAPEALTHATGDAVAAEGIYWIGDWRKHLATWR